MKRNDDAVQDRINMKPIWIVDDDESIRWVLEKALARENLVTESFSNARDAILALQSSTPQVLVSDIRMPGTSGLELLQTIKAKHPHIPVIIITAFSDLDSAVSAFQGGAFEYLAKPFDLDKAVELIRDNPHGNTGSGACHARSVSCDWPAVTIECDCLDYR
jgi:two-component system nitrogen regulation response regulator GlnG